jgi:hypothetical protein
MANTARKQLLPNIQPTDWEKNGSGFQRTQFLQAIDDVIARPLNNRVQASTNATAVVCNGAVQSTGIGTGALIPAKYAETQVQARVTLKASAAGVYQVFVMRTAGPIPANGAAPNVGDVVVGGDSFGGGSLPAGVNTPATLSVIDSGLSATAQYRYYIAISGPVGDALNLINGSNLMVSEF